MAGGASVSSLRARHDAITLQYHEHFEFINQVQQEALSELLPVLENELQLNEEALAKAKAFLEDPTALKLLHSTLTWRLSSSFSTLCLDKIDPLYLSQPLFFFHPSLRDRFGRPCGVLNLKHVARTDDGQLDELKAFIRFGWEVARNWLTALSSREKEENGEKDVMLQIVLIVDLEGAGMSNLEVELLPFFMEMLKGHFPGMVGAIFVLNYGWMYAGMWQLAKRVLPNTALERIIFPSKDDLQEFFDEEHLLIEHGGKVAYDYSPPNPIFTEFSPIPLVPAAPTSSSLPGSPKAAYPSPSPSPSPSSTSLHSDVFQSAPSTRPTTPGSHSRRSSTDLHHLTMRAPRNMIMTPASPVHNSNLELHPTSSVNTTGLLPAKPITPPSSKNEDLSNVEELTPSKKRLGFSLPSIWRRSTPTKAPVSSSNETIEDDSTPRASNEVTTGTSRKGTASGYASGMITPTFAGAGGALRRVTSFAELQERLAATQAAIQSDDSDEDLEDTFRQEGTESVPEVFSRSEELIDVDEEEVEEGSIRNESNLTSARSSRFSSRVQSRDGSPNRSNARLSHRSRNNHALLSPYNTSNPYYGYPTFVPSGSVDPVKVPRPHHPRRRKRDLVRTLTYLAVLRFLSLHRSLRMRILAFFKILLRLMTFRSPKLSIDSKKKDDKSMLLKKEGSIAHVHFSPSTTIHSRNSIKTTSASSSTRFTNPNHLSFESLSHFDRYLYALLLFVLLRTPSRREKIRKGLKVIIVDAPVGLIKIVTKSGDGRKREWIRSVVERSGEKMIEWARKDVATSAIVSNEVKQML